MKCRAMPLDFAKLTLLDCRPLECNANNKKSSRGQRREFKKNEAPGAQGHRSFTTQYFHLLKDPNGVPAYVGVEGAFSRSVAVLTAKH